MAQRTVTVLVCDVCELDGDGVLTHEVTLDGKPKEQEFCRECWDKVRQLFSAARVKRKPRQK